MVGKAQGLEDLAAHPPQAAGSSPSSSASAPEPGRQGGAGSPVAQAAAERPRAPPPRRAAADFQRQRHQAVLILGALLVRRGHSATLFLRLWLLSRPPPPTPMQHLVLAVHLWRSGRGARRHAAAFALVAAALTATNISCSEFFFRHRCAHRVFCQPGRAAVPPSLPRCNRVCRALLLTATRLVLFASPTWREVRARWRHG